MYYIDINVIVSLQFFLNIDNQYIKNILSYSLSEAIRFFSVLNYIILQNYITKEFYILKSNVPCNLKNTLNKMISIIKVITIMNVCGICDCILYFVLIFFVLDIPIYFFHNFSFYVIYLLKFFKNSNNMILKYNIINNHKLIHCSHVFIIREIYK